MSAPLVAVDVRQRLAVALRFRDHFTGAVVTPPLEVRVDALPYVVGAPQTPWRAVRVASDGTYRLVLGQRAVRPSGSVTLTVLCPSGEYAPDGVLSVPLPAAGTPAVRASWLLERELWPTVRLRPPPGETAVVGRFTNGAAVAGYLVRLFKLGGAPLRHARVDARGEFLFRLPELKADVTGTTVTSTVDLGLELRDPASVVVPVVQPPGPAPNAFNVPLGKTSVATFSV